MTTWFTADHHFWHKAILEYCQRPFETVEEMNNTLIFNWNSVVDQIDTVYYLGDLTAGPLTRFIEVFERLNGHIYIVPGGHDKRWLRQLVRHPDTRVLERKIDYTLCHINGKTFSILPPLITIKLEGNIIVLCHYAMRTWDRSHYGSYHFHGHSHGKLPPLGRSTDVGVDASSYYPCSLGYALMECDINAARIEEK